MDRQNWYQGELVSVPNMDLLGTTIDNAVKGLTAMLNNFGIVSGLGVLASAPNSLILQIPAGSICLSDGSVVVTTATRTFDTTPFVPGAGANVTMYLYAVPLQNSDTPTLNSDGVSINYRLFDDFSLVGQLSNVGGAAATGILLCSCVLAVGQTQIAQGGINTAGVPFWTTIAEINTTIATHSAHLATLDGEVATIGGEITAINGQIATLIAGLNRAVNVAALAYQANMVLDATTASQWDIILTGNVTSMAITGANVGQRLLFIIQQGGSGGYTLAWPANFVNTSPINPGLNSVNIVEFVVRGDGNVYPITDISVYNAA